MYLHGFHVDNLTSRVLVKKVRGLLDVLTILNFESSMSRVVSKPIHRQNELDLVVGLMFEKACETDLARSPLLCVSALMNEEDQ
ncbi:unnamed protein product [Notodromas monacha]|uniref:Uncharacterized protein n=1 Tax=Notodromas monacha TaxID=399045 RepID=A0A7R9BGZ0_9CRUS|nr:unnamed protein product [Notodromas monacha]CAG0913968.1 unnamed protein product [Notodromas monacha]